MPDKLTITNNGIEPCQRGPRVRRDLTADVTFSRSTGFGVLKLIIVLAVAVGIVVIYASRSWR